MKLKDFKQAMDWRRRVGFNGGGYVKKKVLPQPKPKEEAEKVNKARKEKTFEKAKGALENPKEVKEMIDKPKRGLVDEPGKYSQQPDSRLKRPGLFKDRKSFIEALKEYWNSFKPDEKPSVTEISNHFSRSDIPRATLVTYLNNNTSYGKLTESEKKQLGRNAAKRVISKGQEDLKKYIRENAKNFDNVDDFEKAILNEFNKPEYRGQDITGTYSPISLEGRERIGSKAGFVYDMPDGQPGLRLKGFKLEEYEKFQPEITTAQGDSYKFIKREGDRGTFIRGQYKAFRQMLGLAMADKNPAVKGRLKKFIDFNKYKQKLTKERKFKIDYKKDIIDIDEVFPGLSKAELRSTLGVNKFLKSLGADFTSAGFSGNIGELKDQFVRLYGPEKGLKEYRFYDENLRKYFRGMGFQKEHTVPRQLIKMDKVPLDQVTKVRGATALVNAVAKNYQDKVISLIKKAEKANLDDRALISGQISDIAKNFKKITGGYPLPFGIDKTGKFELLDPQPLSYRARGSKEVGPISRLALEFTDALRINENIVNNFNQAVKKGVPEKEIFDTFGKSAVPYLSKDYNINQGAIKTDPKFELKGVERKLSETYAKDPKKGYAALFQAFKKDPVNFLKNTRIGTAILRKESEGLPSSISRKPDFITKTATKLLARGALPAIAGFVFGPELLREVGLIDPTFKKTAGLGDAPIVEEEPSLAARTATGTGAAAAVGTKTGRSLLGKTFRTLGTPLSGLGFAATNVASKMKEGQSFADAVVDPITGLELSFPGLFRENISKITKSPTLQKILGLGRVGRLMTPVGLTLAAAGQAQDFYNQYQKLQRMKRDDPEAYEQFRSTRVAPALSAAEQTAIEDMGRSGAAGGGIMKMAGKSSGPPPESGPTSQGLAFLIKRGK
jgi:hypothetical protein